MGTGKPVTTQSCPDICETNPYLPECKATPPEPETKPLPPETSAPAPSPVTEPDILCTLWPFLFIVPILAMILYRNKNIPRSTNWINIAIGVLLLSFLVPINGSQQCMTLAKTMAMTIEWMLFVVITIALIIAETTLFKSSPKAHEKLIKERGLGDDIPEKRKRPRTSKPAVQRKSKTKTKGRR